MATDDDFDGAAFLANPSSFSSSAASLTPARSLVHSVVVASLLRPVVPPRAAESETTRDESTTGVSPFSAPQQLVPGPEEPAGDQYRVFTQPSSAHAKAITEAAAQGKKKEEESGIADATEVAWLLNGVPKALLETMLPLFISKETGCGVGMQADHCRMVERKRLMTYLNNCVKPVLELTANQQPLRWMRCISRLSARASSTGLTPQDIQDDFYDAVGSLRTHPARVAHMALVACDAVAYPAHRHYLDIFLHTAASVADASGADPSGAGRFFHKLIAMLLACGRELYTEVGSTDVSHQVRQSLVPLHRLVACYPELLKEVVAQLDHDIASAESPAAATSADKLYNTPLKAQAHAYVAAFKKFCASAQNVVDIGGGSARLDRGGRHDRAGGGASGGGPNQAAEADLRLLFTINFQEPSAIVAPIIGKAHIQESCDHHVANKNFLLYVEFIATAALSCDFSTVQALLQPLEADGLDWSVIIEQVGGKHGSLYSILQFIVLQIVQSMPGAGGESNNNKATTAAYPFHLTAARDEDGAIEFCLGVLYRHRRIHRHIAFFPRVVDIVRRWPNRPLALHWLTAYVVPSLLMCAAEPLKMNSNADSIGSSPTAAAAAGTAATESSTAAVAKFASTASVPSNAVAAISRMIMALPFEEAQAVATSLRTWSARVAKNPFPEESVVLVFQKALLSAGFNRLTAAVAYGYSKQLATTVITNPFMLLSRILSQTVGYSADEDIVEVQTTLLAHAPPYVIRLLQAYLLHLAATEVKNGETLSSETAVEQRIQPIATLYCVAWRKYYEEFDALVIFREMVRCLERPSRESIIYVLVFTRAIAKYIIGIVLESEESLTMQQHMARGAPGQIRFFAGGNGNKLRFVRKDLFPISRRFDLTNRIRQLLKVTHSAVGSQVVEAIASIRSRLFEFYADLDTVGNPDHGMTATDARILVVHNHFDGLTDCLLFYSHDIGIGNAFVDNKHRSDKFVDAANETSLLDTLALTDIMSEREIKTAAETAIHTLATERQHLTSSSYHSTVTEYARVSIAKDEEALNKANKLIPLELRYHASRAAHVQASLGALPFFSQPLTCARTFTVEVFLPKVQSSADEALFAVELLLLLHGKTSIANRLDAVEVFTEFFFLVSRLFLSFTTAEIVRIGLVMTRIFTHYSDVLGWQSGSNTTKKSITTAEKTSSAGKEKEKHGGTSTAAHKGSNAAFSTDVFDNVLRWHCTLTALMTRTLDSTYVPQTYMHRNVLKLVATLKGSGFPHFSSSTQAILTAISAHTDAQKAVSAAANNLVVHLRTCGSTAEGEEQLFEELWQRTEATQGAYVDAINGTQAAAPTMTEDIIVGNTDSRSQRKRGRDDE